MAENRFDVIPYEDLSAEHTWIRIGKGSFGSVYKAEYLGLDVAVKEVMASDEYDVQKYFAREARHPNVVQYIGLCLAPPAPLPMLPELSFDSLSSSRFHDQAAQPSAGGPQRILIVSEYLTGGNLRAYISSPEATHPFPWRLRLSFSIDAARAIAYMHARRCMHRDLKGENLLITENQRVKAADFGFARIAARNADEMKRMSYCGSTPNMAPEILLGVDFDLQVDVFSLGVVFCEILGRVIADDDIFARGPPFYAIDPSEVRDRASPGYPEAYLRLALDCCAAEPSARPTMIQVLERLRAIERDLIAAERKDPTIKAYAVGSLSFASPRRTIIAANKPSEGTVRPGAPPRMPSFGGKVEVPQRRSSMEETSESESDADEDVKTAAAVLGIQPAARASGSRIGAERYSVEVVRRSKIQQQPSTTDTDTLSSVLTVRPNQPPPPQPVVRAASPAQSLISIPSSWLVKPAAQVVGLDAGTAASSDTSDASMPSTPDATAAVVQTTHAKDGSATSYLTARTTTPSLANATIDGDDSGAVERPASPRTALMASIVAGNTTAPTEDTTHRFTLVSPAWARIFGAPVPTVAPPPLSRRTSIDGVDPVRLSATMRTTHCACCGRKLGMLRAYMICDEGCGFRVHVKCADAAPPCYPAGHSPSHSVDKSAASAAPPSKLKSNRLRRISGIVV